MSSPKIEVSDEKVLKAFARLSSKKQSKATRQGMVASARILQRAAKKELKGILKPGASKSPNWWNKRPLDSGIKVSPQRNIDRDGVKVHILGDFRLKFFERGTQKRFTYSRTYEHRSYSENTLDRGKYRSRASELRKKGYVQTRRTKKSNRGKVFKAGGGKHFFQKATDLSERQVFDTMEDNIKKSIIKAYEGN